MIDETTLCARYRAIKERLDERGHRLLVAGGKIAAGYGGTATMSRVTEVAHATTAGLTVQCELDEKAYFNKTEVIH